MIAFLPHELQLAGFQHPRSKISNGKAYELIYNIDGSNEDRTPALVLTISSKSVNIKVRSCCPFVNATSYTLRDLALLLRGLKHIYYAKLVETYIQKKEGNLPSPEAAAADENGES